MVSQPNSERHQGERGVRGASRGKGGAAGHVHVGVGVEGQHGSDDRSGRIGAHAEAAHRVIGIGQRGGAGGGLQDPRKPGGRAETGGSEGFADNGGEAAGDAALDGAGLPVNQSSGLGEGIESVRAA